MTARSQAISVAIPTTTTITTTITTKNPSEVSSRAGAERLEHQLGGAVGSENGLPPHSTQDIRAELVGIDTCIAAGQVARGATPVLAMCRQLIEAGHAPNLSLRAYRGDVLCVTVRRIGEGAHLAVKTAGNGCPVFALDTLQKGAAGPPVRRKAPAHVRWV